MDEANQEIASTPATPLFAYEFPRISQYYITLLVVAVCLMKYEKVMKHTSDSNDN